MIWAVSWPYFSTVLKLKITLSKIVAYSIVTFDIVGQILSLASLKLKKSTSPKPVGYYCINRNYIWRFLLLLFPGPKLLTSDFLLLFINKCDQHQHFPAGMLAGVIQC